MLVPGAFHMSPTSRLWISCASAAALTVTSIWSSHAREWRAHEVRQLAGNAGIVRLLAQMQIVTESWNRVVAVPYMVYMPEKDRILMLVNCDYPHHAEVLFSNDRGETWSDPRPATGDRETRRQSLTSDGNESMLSGRGQRLNLQRSTLAQPRLRPDLEEIGSDSSNA